jgi:hypothetical protein
VSGCRNLSFGAIVKTGTAQDYHEDFKPLWRLDAHPLQGRQHLLRRSHPDDERRSGFEQALQA